LGALATISSRAKGVLASVNAEAKRIEIPVSVEVLKAAKKPMIPNKLDCSNRYGINISWYLPCLKTIKSRPQPAFIIIIWCSKELING